MSRSVIILIFSNMFPFNSEICSFAQPIVMFSKNFFSQEYWKYSLSTINNSPQVHNNKCFFLVSFHFIGFLGFSKIITHKSPYLIYLIYVYLKKKKRVNEHICKGLFSIKRINWNHDFVKRKYLWKSVLMYI